MARDGYKLLSVELPEDTHAEWDDFATEHDEYNNLSHMIRRAVNREMMRVEQGEEFRPEGEDISVDIEPVEEAVYDLENRLGQMEESLREEMRNVDLAAGEVTDEDELKEVMYHVGQYIPLVDGEEELREVEVELELPAEERAQITGTVEDVHEAVNWNADEDEGYTKFDVEQALAKLEKARGTIRSVFDSGTRRYYEVDQ